MDLARQTGQALDCRLWLGLPTGYALLLDSGEPKMGSFVEELQRRLRVRPRSVCGMPPEGLQRLGLPLHPASGSHDFDTQARLQLKLDVLKLAPGRP